MNDTTLLMIIFDVFNLKLAQLKNMKYEAKMFYNQAIRINQKLINILNKQLKISSEKEGIDVVQMYDDVSITLYNIISKFEKLDVEQLNDFIQYIEAFEPKSSQELGN